MCDSYEKAEEIETVLIEKYDTFYNGLNESINGKGNHLCPRFTTRGFKYSEESKQKMRDNHWSKTGAYTQIGRKHSEKTKKRLSEARKGTYWGKNRKIPPEDWQAIYNSYINDELNFDKEFVAELVKPSQKESVLTDEIDYNELKSQNGKPLTKKALYCLWYSKVYNIAPAAIRKILNNKGKTSEDYK